MVAIASCSAKFIACEHRSVPETGCSRHFGSSAISQQARFALWQPRLLPGLPSRCRPVHWRHICRAARTHTSRVYCSAQAESAPTAPARAEGASADLAVIWRRLVTLGMPYWTDPDTGRGAQFKLAGVVALTLGTTVVSVTFNFLGRDFFNALAEKDVDKFYHMIGLWIAALFGGIPVFVFRSYYQSKLALDWREWMTQQVTADYFADRTFYQVQAGSLVDNPDQRISSDIRQFTDTALGFVMTILNAVVDLVCFSDILFSIYPPLFVALVVYSVGGTVSSLWLGRRLVGLNFQQEAQEANFRYGLVRVRENAESIAFYGGEESEQRLLFQRLKAAILNYGELLIASRNLDFFTSFYRYLIQILPAAVVAPLFFRGEIEFGVINQSSSAFNHILSDVSLVVYQLESLAAFSAVIDRLGEFKEVVDSPRSAAEQESIQLVDAEAPREPEGVLLELEGLTLCTPDGRNTLVQQLDLVVREGQSVLIVGPSGAGKTSTLRAIAGLWGTGAGAITRHGRPVSTGGGGGDIFFVPQRPYLVLGTLRDQLLYPTWAGGTDPAPPAQASQQHGANVDVDSSSSSSSTGSSNNGAEAAAATMSGRAVPGDAELEAVLRRVRLGPLLDRTAASSNGSGGLDTLADWSSILSLGEQQRLAFARILLSKPRLVLMDESTSALDTGNEEHLYAALRSNGITFVSVGHRPTLVNFHDLVLRLLPPPDAGANGAAGQAAKGWELVPAGQMEMSAVL